MRAPCCGPRWPPSRRGPHERFPSPVEIHDELPPDPELRAALLAAVPGPPPESVNWAALSAAVVARADAPLARRRRRHAWRGAWQSARRAGAWAWLRPALPLALAAGLAAVLLWPRPDPRAADPAPAGPLATSAAPHSATPSAEMLLADVSDEEFGRIVSGRADPAALLRLAVGEP